MPVKKKASNVVPDSMADVVTVGKSELRIKYDNSHDLLDRLQTIAQHVSRLHSHQLLAAKASVAATRDAIDQLSTADIPSVLGPQKASEIVSGCAGQSDITTKLGDIPGLDLRIFQNCVQQGVLAAGYTPPGIPASSSNTLWDVVVAIQTSSAK